MNNYNSQQAIKTNSRRKSDFKRYHITLNRNVHNVQRKIHEPFVDEMNINCPQGSTGIGLTRQIT